MIRRERFLSALSVLTGLLLWELLAGKPSSSALLPAPSRILSCLGGLLASGDVAVHLRVTALHAASGFFCGTSAGLLCGLLCAYWRPFGRILDPWINAVFPLPKVMLVPMLLASVGAGSGLFLFVTAIESFFQVAVAVRAGLPRVNPSLIEAAKTMGATRGELVWHVVAPSILPYLLAGMHLGLLQALRATVVLEAMLSLKGIGSMLWTSGEWLRMDVYYAYIIVLAAMGVLIIALFRWTVRFLVPWAELSASEDLAS